jgi:hypothetical protein
VVAFVVLLGGTSVGLTQSTAGPLGVADASARQLLVDAILHDSLRTASNEVGFTTSEVVAVVRRAYDRLPVAARGPATTVAFAWAKAFVNSPAFAAAYEKQREGQKPAGFTSSSSVDGELKKLLDDQRAAHAEARKMAAKLPEKDRAAFLAMLKEQEARLDDPERIKTLRSVLEAQRGETTARADKSAVAWDTRYPANPRTFVREHLVWFLDVTEDIDYSLAFHVVRSPSGETLGFLSPGYTGMPWQRIHAILAGREAVDAGRAAAAAWLTELDGK